MTKLPVDIAAEIERLQALGTETLRYEWRRHHQTPPPKRLSREFLLRGITYQIQERTFGGLSKSVLRRMSAAAPEPPFGSNRMAPRTIVKPGTRFVREWNGQPHTVLVHADGVEWRGTRYAIELDPHYCDVIVRRLEPIMSCKTTFVGTGVSFRELAAERTVSRIRSRM